MDIRGTEYFGLPIAIGKGPPRSPRPLPDPGSDPGLDGCIQVQSVPDAVRSGNPMGMPSAGLILSKQQDDKFHRRWCKPKASYSNGSA